MNISYFYTIIFFCILICSILLFGGVIVNNSMTKSKKHKKIIGQVQNVIQVDNNNYQTTVIYSISNTNYTTTIISKKNRNVGDLIDLYYKKDPRDPRNLSDNVDNNNKHIAFGGSIMICAICMLLILIGSFGSKNKNLSDDNNNKNCVIFTQSNTN